MTKYDDNRSVNQEEVRQDLAATFFGERPSCARIVGSEDIAECFSTDYFESRSRFIEAAQSAGAILEACMIDAKGPKGEKLGADIAYIGDPSAHKVLLHVSGTHGPEGFAGSAIQTDLLRSKPQPPAGCALLFVHALNPYGMAHLRRVNEEGVDPNRNFMQEGWSGTQSGYERYAQLMDCSDSEHLEASISEFKAILQSDELRPDFMSTVMPGQYEYQDHLFYGGSGLAQASESVSVVLRQRLSHLQELFLIDVHTGLGASGFDVLLGETRNNEKGIDRLEMQFGKHFIDPEAVVPYFEAVRGGVGSGIAELFPDAKIWALAQEFGTLPVDQVLPALLREGKYTLSGDKRLMDYRRGEFRDTFEMKNRQWREAIIKRGAAVVLDSLEILNESRRDL